MANTNPIQQKLQAILKEEAFEHLEQFSDPAKWQSWGAEERDALAMLFALRGEKQLCNGDDKAWDSLLLAIQAASNRSLFQYRVAETLMNLPNDLKMLKRASETLENCVKGDPSNFDAWTLWGIVLMRKGAHEGDCHELQLALQKMQKAEEISSGIDNDRMCRLYWTWGRIWQILGKIDGEALDYRNAIDMFRKTTEFSPNYSQFWSNYGDSCAEMGFLVASQEYCCEAIECYRKALRLKNDDIDSWSNLGYVFQYLYDLTGAEEHFECACHAYEQAIKITGTPPSRSNAQVWFKWAQLLSAWGRTKGDHEVLKDSLEKFEKADACDPQNALVLSRWGDTLVMLGSLLERYDLLREAEEKIALSLTIDESDPRTWYIYGSCFNELGRYFQDEAYYQRAIVYFEKGISLDKTDPLLWHGIAIAYFDLAEIQDSTESLEKTLRLFAKATDHAKSGWPQLWNDWGVAFMKLSEMTGERQYLEAAVTKFEQAFSCHQASGSDDCPDPEWLYNYGCSLDFLGDYYEDPIYYEKAVLYLTKALQEEPSFFQARYNLALALSHLGEATGDLEMFHKSNEQFQVILSQDSEDEMAWNDWGLMSLNMADLYRDDVAINASQELFGVAESKFLKSVSLGCNQAFYNLACLYSMTGHLGAAMHYLERSKHSGALPPVEELMHDDWIDALRETATFKEFVNQLMREKDTP